MSYVEMSSNSLILLRKILLSFEQTNIFEQLTADRRTHGASCQGLASSRPKDQGTSSNADRMHIKFMQFVQKFKLDQYVAQ